MWVYYSIKHSFMLFFTSEIFQQNVLQESLDTINRSCMKDHETFRLAQHAPAIQADVRALGAQLALTQIIDKRGSISSRSVLIPFYKPLTEKSWKDELLRYQKREVQRWMHAQRSCTVIKETLTSPNSELIDETTQCEKCEVHHAKRKVLLHM